MPAGFSVRCNFGQTLPVTTSQAGSTIRCPCGLDVAVPSLGRLRESVGQDRYESGVVDVIRRMIQSGELPSGDLCVVSGKPTNDLIELDLLVPRFFKTEDRSNPVTLLALGLVGVFVLAAFGPKEVAEEEGATRMRVPMLVAGRYHGKVRRMGPSRLRRLLRKEPMYAELIEENPRTRIAVLGNPLN